MAGIKLVIDMEPATALQLAWRAAQDLQFRLTPIQDGTFQASKGRAIWSLLVGPAAPHCSFTISVHSYPDGTTDLVLDRNTPWSSGVLGLRRIQAEAETLMKRSADAIEANGGKVRECKEL